VRPIVTVDMRLRVDLKVCWSRECVIVWETQSAGVDGEVVYMFVQSIGFQGYVTM
jgi:hypothetical protein